MKPLVQEDEHDYWIAKHEEVDAEVLNKLMEKGVVTRNQVVALRREIRPTLANGILPSTKALHFVDEIITAVLTQAADFDGGQLQEMAVKHGLLRVEEMAAPCGENCACASDGVPFWPAFCYRKTYHAPKAGTVIKDEG